MGIFISVDSLRDNIEEYIANDEKLLAGGDIIVESNALFKENLSKNIGFINENYNVTFTNIKDFASIAYSVDTELTQLSQVKIVDDNYPLYGNIELSSGNDYKLLDSQIIAEKALVNNLNISVGDVVTIGNHNFTLVDTIESLPDSPVTLFSIGPTILMPEVNENQTGLLGSRSRIEYITKIKTQNNDDAVLISDILKDSADDKEDVDLYNESNSTLQSFLENFLFFIKLISVFIIFIAGMGLTSILTSYLNAMEKTIGIKKVLGSKNNSLVIYSLSTVMILSLISFSISLFFSAVFVEMLPKVLSSIVPEDLDATLSFSAVLKGLALSIIVPVLFTIFPIQSLSKVKPTQIFRKEKIENRNLGLVAIYSLLTFLFFSFLIYLELENLRVGLVIMLGFTGFILFLLGASWVVLKVIKILEKKLKSVSIKLAIKGLFRIGNKTLLTITAISISLTLIFTLSFVETNLQEQFVTSFPPDAPNLFIIDIPLNLKDNFSSYMSEYNISIYPIIRGPAIRVNDMSISELSEEIGEGEPVTRDFSLTYSNEVLPSERVVDSINGREMFADDWSLGTVVQVSILKDIADRMRLGLGDRVVFLVQGIEIEAEVVSIRERVEQQIGAFFYFTFEEEVLKDAPQTLFSTLNVNENESLKLQSSIARDFPTITVIDAQRAAKTVGDILSELSNITTFFTAFSLLGGILILVSSILATSQERLKESIYYKLVGGNKRFILKILVSEFAIIAVVSSFLSLVVSLVISWLVSSFLLDISFTFLVKTGLMYILITIVVIILIGVLSILSILKKKPIEYIRENNVE
jgi:putative ABC transport system permease protein